MKNEKYFKELEKLYKPKTNWVLILKIISVLAGAVALGWFIGSIIILKMSCGG